MSEDGGSFTEFATLSHSSSTARIGSLVWDDLAGDPFGSTSGWSGGLSAGTHTLRIEVTTGTGSSTDSADFDVVAPADNRYSYTFDGSVTTQSGGHNTLSGPELYPASIGRVFEDAETPYSVTGGRIESTWNDTSGSQAVALSNDLGQSYSMSSNTDTYETDFADTGPSVRLKVTLSRYGSRTSATPTSGFNGQSLQSYTLKADLSDEPLVVQRSFDGQAQSVLSELANAADAVWEFRRQADGTETVTWTYPGQRQSDRDPDVTAFEYDETLEGQYDTVTVRGSARPVVDERFDSNYGTTVILAHDHLLTGKEVVYTPGSNPRETFAAGQDYELDTLTGEITVLSSGDMADSTEYAIDYQWRPQDTVDNGATDPREKVVDLPSITTVRGAGLAAVRIQSEVDRRCSAGRSSSRRRRSTGRSRTRSRRRCSRPLTTSSSSRASPYRARPCSPSSRGNPSAAWSRTSASDSAR